MLNARWQNSTRIFNICLLCYTISHTRKRFDNPTRSEEDWPDGHFSIYVWTERSRFIHFNNISIWNVPLYWKCVRKNSSMRGRTIISLYIFVIICYYWHFFEVFDSCLDNGLASWTVGHTEDKSEKIKKYNAINCSRLRWFLGWYRWCRQMFLDNASDWPSRA